MSLTESWVVLEVIKRSKTRYHLPNTAENRAEDQKTIKKRKITSDMKDSY